MWPVGVWQVGGWLSASVGAWPTVPVVAWLAEFVLPQVGAPVGVLLGWIQVVCFQGAWLLRVWRTFGLRGCRDRLRRDARDGGLDHHSWLSPGVHPVVSVIMVTITSHSPLYQGGVSN